MNVKNLDERIFLRYSYGKWKQKSRPVGILKPNAYSLYDMFGLVCENVILQKPLDRYIRTSYCKGSFLTDSLQALNFGGWWKMR